MMIDKTSEDIAQDKRLAQLANKIDELQLAIEQLQRHTAPLLRISDTLDHIGQVISKKLKGK